MTPVIRWSNQTIDAIPHCLVNIYIFFLSCPKLDYLRINALDNWDWLSCKAASFSSGVQIKTKKNEKKGAHLCLLSFLFLGIKCSVSSSCGFCMFVPGRTLLDSWTVHAYIHWNWLKGRHLCYQVWHLPPMCCIKPFIYPLNDTPIHLLISRMIFWVKVKQAWLASYTYDSLLFVSFYLYVVFRIY